MKIKIDEKMICLPPYVSTTWDQVSFLQSEEDPETHLFTLDIHFNEGKVIRVPDLDPSVIDIAFTSHVRFLESKTPKAPRLGEEIKAVGNFIQQLTGLNPEQIQNIPIRFNISGMEGATGMDTMEHNIKLSDSPDMPTEILEKISGMIKMLSNGEASSFPKPEAHCNCPHCQVARSVHNMQKEPESEIDQPVDEKELTFRDWEIEKKGDQLYKVTNPIDANEHYNVFLGTPIGCTCGHSHCEHIKAVLYS